MENQDDDFYKRKPIKLKRESETDPTFETVEDTPAPESTAKIFKPVERKSPYAASNLVMLLIPIGVTVALGFGCYKGFVAFREITLRADGADRVAIAAMAETTSMKSEINRLESESANIEQSLPRLRETIRSDARSRAASRYRQEIDEAHAKTEAAKQANAEATARKVAEAETIANTKVRAAKDELSTVEKRLAELRKESDELRTFLRANNRTMHPAV